MMPMGEYELEALPEFEYEWEGELESEEFLSRLANWVRGRGRGMVLGTALRLLPPQQMPALPPPPPPIVQTIDERRRGPITQREFEGELNPIRRVYPDALMEHLGHAAMEAESEAEAEAFIGALIPLAARIVPRVAPAIMRAAPGLIRSAAGVTRILRRNPTTRPLVRAVPSIVRRTAADLARQASQGRAVTPRTAIRALERRTYQTLGNRRQCAQALQRSNRLDQRYHRAAAQGPRVARAMMREW